MTVSMADIPVLHSAELVHLYPQFMIPYLPQVAQKHYQGE
jgi:hypothetical protein